MYAQGNPYENAFIESFFKNLKQEEVYLWQYEHFSDVAKRITYFIEDVYNQKEVVFLFRLLASGGIREVIS